MREPHCRLIVQFYMYMFSMCYCTIRIKFYLEIKPYSYSVLSLVMIGYSSMQVNYIGSTVLNPNHDECIQLSIEIPTLSQNNAPVMFPSAEEVRNYHHTVVVYTPVLLLACTCILYVCVDGIR